MWILPLIVHSFNFLVCLICRLFKGAEIEALANWTHINVSWKIPTEAHSPGYLIRLESSNAQPDNATSSEHGVFTVPVITNRGSATLPIYSCGPHKLTLLSNRLESKCSYYLAFSIFSMYPKIYLCRLLGNRDRGPLFRLICVTHEL